MESRLAPFYRGDAAPRSCRYPTQRPRSSEAELEGPRAGAGSTAAAATAAGARNRATLAIGCSREGGEHRQTSYGLTFAPGTGCGLVHAAHGEKLLEVICAGLAGVFVDRQFLALLDRLIGLVRLALMRGAGVQIGEVNAAF